MHLSAFTPVRPLKRSGSGLQLPVGGKRCKICVCGSPGFNALLPVINRPASRDPEPRHVVTDEVEYVPTSPVCSTPEPDEEPEEEPAQLPPSMDDYEDSCEGSCRLGTPCPGCGGDTSSVCTRCGADGCMEFEGCFCDCRNCNYDSTRIYDCCVNSCECTYEEKSILPRKTLRRITSFQAVARGARVRSERVSVVDWQPCDSMSVEQRIAKSFAAALEKGEVIYLE